VPRSGAHGCRCATDTTASRVGTASGPAVPEDRGRPLLITGDGPLIDRVTGLIAATGVDPETHSDPGHARGRWLAAPVVLVGADVAAAIAELELPRRPGVVVIGAPGQPSTDPAHPTVWRFGLRIGAEAVAVLPDDERWLADRVADAVDGEHADAPLLAVIGGRGGAGASTLATAIAVSAARREVPTTLVDADPVGGGLDLLAGVEDCEGLRWSDLTATRGRMSGAALRRALPGTEMLRIVSWDRMAGVEIPSAAARTVIAAARRGSDLVVVDLPRRADQIGTEIMAAATLALLVVPAELRAVAARIACAAMALNGNVQLVVRTPAPGGLAAADIGQVLGLPLAGVLGHDPTALRDAETGMAPACRGRGPIADLASALLGQVPSPARARRGRAA
jgi:secretion/DNA translocation related CpaE-like protein